VAETAASSPEQLQVTPQTVPSCDSKPQTTDTSATDSDSTEASKDMDTDEPKNAKDEEEEK
jgi:hypothetical protein